MPFYLYKLKFQTPVHFGADVPGIGLEKAQVNCHADTFFSALCIETLKLYGEDGLNQLVEMADRSEFLLSDLFPYIDEDHDTRFLLPKPVLAVKNKKVKTDRPEDRSSQKKKMKKMEFISTGKWDDYLKFLSGKVSVFEPEDIEFSSEMIVHKVAVARGDDEKNRLYSVTSHVFKPNAGLYVIVKMPESYEARLNKTMESLGYSGIGGKRTSGYGKFKLKDDLLELDVNEFGTNGDKKLAEVLNAEDSTYNMTLSAIAPEIDQLNDETIKGSFYRLIPRRGFVSSAEYNSQPLKRKPVAMFAAGSCFKEKLRGRILNLAGDGGHPVYRYGKPIYVGVDI